MSKRAGAADKSASSIPMKRLREGQQLGKMNYQSEKVVRSLRASGKVFVARDLGGTDSAPEGIDNVPLSVPINNGRGGSFTLDSNAFEFRRHEYDHVDYDCEQEILEKYYPEVCRYIKEVTGAERVIAFDHNIRESGIAMAINETDQERQKAAAEAARPKISGGNALQGPAAVVHNDYTWTSAPRRLEQMAKVPGKNDTVAKLTGGKPLMTETELSALKNNRYMFVNLWRNITDSPVQRRPLALCDGQTIPSDDLVTFEIKYADRTGENYFARYSEAQKWYYFPEMVKEECILIKCWDSKGKQFDGRGADDSVASTFSLHTAFEPVDENGDTTEPADAPARKSIEVRTVVFMPSINAQASKL